MVLWQMLKIVSGKFEDKHLSPKCNLQLNFETFSNDLFAFNIKQTLDNANKAVADLQAFDQ